MAKLKNKVSSLSLIVCLMVILVVVPVGYSLQSYEVSTLSYQVVKIDDKSQFEWVGEVENNTVLPISGVAVRIIVKSKEGSKLLEKHIGDIDLSKFGKQEIKFAVESQKFDNIDSDNIIVVATVTKPSQDYGFKGYDDGGQYFNNNSSRDSNNRKRTTSRDEEDYLKKEKHRQEANEAARLFENLKIEFNIKQKVWSTCPGSYSSNSYCAKLRRDMEALRREMDKAYREYQRYKIRYGK